LNSTFGFRLVLAPNYLLITLIRVSVIRGVTGQRRTPLAPGGGHGWRRKHAHGGQLDWGVVLAVATDGDGSTQVRVGLGIFRVDDGWIGDFSLNFLGYMRGHVGGRCEW
jgi:hypothetical protein